MSSVTPVKIRIPRQDLQEFDIFALTAEAARAWAGNLPVTSSLQVARQLNTVLTRLNRVEIAPELRFDILEALRPALSVATTNLSRRFLKQPLVMPDEPRQMAELTNSLYTLAGTAYTVVAIHAIQQRKTVRRMNAARLVCESIHRAIRFAGLKLLQTFQLYRPVELQGWLALHQLYALAEGQQLCELTVADELYGDGTITAGYLHALILGCCKPNQLRQGDLAAIYRGLQDWSTLLQIEHSNSRKSLFLVDLDSDRPPLYSSLYQEPPGPRTRYIDTEPLLRHMTKLAASGDKQGIVFDKDSVISPSLLTHLIAAFGSMSMRNFTRKKGNKTMWIGLGLSACHYYLAGEKTFLQVLHGDDYVPELTERLTTNPFLERHNDSDVWQRSNPEEDFVSPHFTDGESDLAHKVSVDRETLAKLENLDDAEIPEEEHYAAHKVTMFDASPGGYCLEWTAQLPGDIKTGDIACIREDDSPRWSVAVIRWLSRTESGKTLIGLELLSPGGKPCGARMQLQKKGEETEPMRALLLPEIKLVGQSHTLITPRSGFRERQKIILSRKGEEFYVQLLRQVAVTGSFVQFDFRYIKQLGEVLAEDKSRPRDSSFDSLWSNI